ncbi:MAG: barstar family protein [Neisseriaceae bacterium]|nr:barstar family protein [Neisseriaceae bacterium]MBP6861896.1 barstar family protein [Neisseriaceae bacterium]
MIFPNEPAVYVCTPKQLTALATDAPAQRWPWPKLNQVNKASIMMATKSLFVLPKYFGDNWDALYDALTEQAWCPDAPNLWTLPLHKASDVNWADMAIFLDVCQDLCDFLASNAITLYVQVIATEKQLAHLNDHPLWP